MRACCHGQQRGPVVVRAAVLGLALVLIGAPVSGAADRKARLADDLENFRSSQSTTTADVIVQGDQQTVDSLVLRHGARLKRRLAGGAVLQVTRQQLDGMAADASIASLALDTEVNSSMAVSAATLGASPAWELANGLAPYTGKGVGIEVIDSGVAPHKALADRVVASVDFTRSSGTGRDLHGHGTHVAGIIGAELTGDGDEDGQASAAYQGIAPGARLVSLKVLDGNGRGTTSSVIDAIDWTIANRDRYGIRVINMSLGHPVYQAYKDDPLCQAVERAVDAGIVVVVSAGNTGQSSDGKTTLGSI